MSKENWCVYLLECLDGSFYTGITNNLEKRMKAHKEGKGSKYVRAKGFKQLLLPKSYLTKSEALKAEYKIKQLKKEDKLKFFN
jgi:putative endonuclease